MATRRQGEPTKTPKTQREFIDYRFEELHDKIDNVKSDLTSQVNRVEQAVQTSIQHIDNKLDNTFATRDYVDNKVKGIGDDVVLLKKIVYGAVGLILTGFILAIMGLVFIKH